MTLRPKAGIVDEGRVIPYREVGPETEKAHEDYDAFLDELGRRLDDPKTDRNLLCRDILYEIYFGKSDGFESALSAPHLGLAAKSTLHSLDPRNITLEPEYYGDIDPSRYYERKPLIWLWIMFDRSPLGWTGALGFRFRYLLARKIFKSCGGNVKIFPGVEVSFGYNLTVGSHVVLHKYVFLDDRGEIVIGDDASLSDFANVYSHHHDIVEQKKVFMGRTVIGRGARITYHATVLSGTRVGDNSMVGTFGLVTKDLPDHHVGVGIPAKPIRKKPNAGTWTEPKHPF